MDGDLAGEIQTRLRHLDFVLRRIVACGRELGAVGERYRDHMCAMAVLQGVMAFSSDSTDEANPLTAMVRDLEDRSAEIQVLTEAFYYGAARIRGILQCKGAPLPFLGGFECVGVQDVRNKLIEHPEKGDSGVVSVSFGYQEGTGPVIKPHRRPGQEHIFPDNGLCANATEFVANLTSKLEQAMAKAHSEHAENPA